MDLSQDLHQVPGTYTVFYDVTSSTVTPTGDTVVCVEQTRSADIVVRDIIQLLSRCLHTQRRWS